MSRRAVTGSDVKRWRGMIAEGLTYHQIAKQEGRSASTIIYHIDANKAENDRARHRRLYTERTATPEGRQALWDARREYQRSYHRGYQRDRNEKTDA